MLLDAVVAAAAFRSSRTAADRVTRAPMHSAANEKGAIEGKPGRWHGMPFAW
ncbi:hypothetical protein ACF1A5_27275 [Streptomyces sp. NPDC014864]|uniref:hypothetical protein n=1 Tax=Streptomyces sp. NPDC014864 TaxID=3364924 RepID=UPI0036FF058E